MKNFKKIVKLQLLHVAFHMLSNTHLTSFLHQTKKLCRNCFFSNSKDDIFNVCREKRVKNRALLL